MYCYKLTLAYDGTRYRGWQIQHNAPSIQQEIEKVLTIILRNAPIRLIGSGRTDAGVHAKGQTAHFKIPFEVDITRLHYSLNGLLPLDIRVKKTEKAPVDFHARYSAVGKEYHYRLYLERVSDPFSRLYCWHLFDAIDLDLLKEGAALFVGRHDFSSFANEAHSGSAAIDPVRTLYRLDVCPCEGGVTLQFEGNGFLYKMVRNITGTLIDLAKGKMTLSDIRTVFEAKDRRRAGRSAPPEGLFLMRVDYPPVS